MATDTSRDIKGRIFSETGWGLTFDYIIIHEAGHEWFANNITYQDMPIWVDLSWGGKFDHLFGKPVSGLPLRSNCQVTLTCKVARQVIKMTFP